MLSETVYNAMNDQIKHELFSSYQYLAMSAYFEAHHLNGFAHWMRLQANEELEHALKFYEHIHERGGRVILQAIDQPRAEFESPLSVFEAALAHEQKVTGLIHRIYGLAADERDYASQTFLQWFVTEQVEEEKNAGDVVERLRLIGDDRALLLLLDRELAEREGD